MIMECEVLDPFASLVLDFAAYGLTDGCAGCDRIKSGIGVAVNHSQRCRDRVEALLKDTAEGRERLERFETRFAHYAEEKKQQDEHQVEREDPRREVRDLEPVRVRRRAGCSRPSACAARFC